MGLQASGWQLAGSGQLRARRENASHLVLTVPALPAYAVSSPETVVVTIPAEALLQHHSALGGLASFVVNASAVSEEELRRDRAVIAP